MEVPKYSPEDHDSPDERVIVFDEADIAEFDSRVEARLERRLKENSQYVKGASREMLRDVVNE